MWLLIPNVTTWIPASFGFLLGIIFLLSLDSLILHLYLDSEESEGIRSKYKKTTMMILDVALG